VVWSLLLIAGSEGPTLISLAASHLHTVGVFAAHVVGEFEEPDVSQAVRPRDGHHLYGMGVMRQVDRAGVSVVVPDCLHSDLSGWRRKRCELDHAAVTVGTSATFASTHN
jgi:hypothetical protein